MRFVLLVILIALAVLLLLHVGKGRPSNPVKEADAILDKTKQAILPSQLQQVEAALDAYTSEHGYYPDDLSQIVPDFLPNPDFLIDPWGTQLRLVRGEGEKTFLLSAGPDRAFGSGDDIRRSL
jgi:hypothetical protein